MKILIVDDDQDSRLILRKTLESAGNQVAEATHGKAALDNARSSRPELIISDILMPVMDGFMFCREVKNDPTLRDIPFIFYTATYTDPEDERLATGLGASRYILKPIEVEEFLAIIAAVVEEARRCRLPVPDKPAADQAEMSRMYESSLARKLDEKVRQIELYREIFANTNDAVFITDPTGRIIRQNPALRRFTAGNDDEPGGLTPAMIYGDAVFRRIWQVVVETGSFRGEQEILCSTGKKRQIDLAVFSIRNEDQEAVNYVWTMRDITEQKNLAAQLLRSQKMEAVGNLAAGIAHDFNNMLTAILGYVELALLRLRPGDQLAEDLKQVELAARRAANLVRQLLLFSRKERLEFVRIDLNTSIENLTKMLRRIIGEDIVLIVDLEPASWEIEADPSNIDQVVMNLAVNARDAMPHGGKLTIKTENVEIDEEYSQGHPDARPGSYLCLSVTDTGKGIPPEVLPSIFEPFFTTKEAGKGTGLGLAVVYGIARAHKGWVTVGGEPDQGASFRVYFPAVAGGNAAGQKEARGGLAVVPGQGEKILVIEDDEAIRILMKKALRQNGYAPSAFNTAEEGLAFFEKEGETLSLVISDVVLPGMDGITLADRIHSLRPELAVLLCSGYTDQKPHWRRIQEQGLPFLGKPFTISRLLKTIQGLIRGS